MAVVIIMLDQYLKSRGSSFRMPVLAVAAMGLPYHWSALIVAVACMAVAIILALIGKSRLASSTFAPKRTLKQVKSDIDAVKEMARA